MNRYYVYVIELRPVPVRSRPNEQPRYARRGDVYVGSSGLLPADRLKHHRTSHRGSRFVRKRGVKLRPDLYEGFGPFATRNEATRAEHWLAHELSRDGFNVYGSCSQRRTPACVL